jgi:hypothetical protein
MGRGRPPAGGGGGGTDPYFSSVKSLLHFDGSNGSTTFTDQISRTWTPNNATISTTQSKYGGASGYFSGSSSWLTTPYVTADFDWWVGDWTLEYWIYPISFGGVGNLPSAIGNMDQGGSLYWGLGPLGGSSGTLGFYYWGPGSNPIQGAGALSTGSWQHVAATHTTSGITLFNHGTMGSTTAAASGTSSTGVPLTINGWNSGAFNCYLDDLRLTQGVARYTGNFTPPTAPFPDS